MNGELLSRAKELFTPANLLTALVFVISMVFAVILSCRLGTNKGKKGASATVTAYLRPGSVYREGEGKYGGPADHIDAKYDYRVDGKSYVYRFRARQVPPGSVTLCYKNDPKRAWRPGERSFIRSCAQVALLLLPFALTALAGIILGAGKAG
ncbi:MAG: hypothetical protein K5784_09880 [Clostridiales bacterium]|nr:hypothetical protein [Clostridiales bacterium]